MAHFWLPSAYLISHLLIRFFVLEIKPINGNIMSLLELCSYRFPILFYMYTLCFGTWFYVPQEDFLINLRFKNHKWLYLIQLHLLIKDSRTFCRFHSRKRFHALACLPRGFAYRFLLVIWGWILKWNFGGH